MATKLSSVTRKRARINCTLGDARFFIEVDPSKFTSGWIAQAEALKPADRNCEIASLITDWDLVDDDEQVLPVSVETLMSFPIELVTYLWDQMITEFTPGKKNGEDSDAG